MVRAFRLTYLAYKGALSCEIQQAQVKRAAIAITTILIGGGGAATFAYWYAGGTGTGSASTGTIAAITAVQTSTITGLAPGVPPRP